MACGVCNGHGQVESNVICTTCSGSGQHAGSSCSWCGGSGARRGITTCTWCGGTGGTHADYTNSEHSGASNRLGSQIRGLGVVLFLFACGLLGVGIFAVIDMTRKGTLLETIGANSYWPFYFAGLAMAVLIPFAAGALNEEIKPVLKRLLLWMLGIGVVLIALQIALHFTAGTSLIHLLREWFRDPLEPVRAIVSPARWFERIAPAGLASFAWLIGFSAILTATAFLKPVREGRHGAHMLAAVATAVGCFLLL